MKRWLKRILFFLISIFILLSILPYLLKVSDYRDFTLQTPYKESLFSETRGITLHYILYKQSVTNPRGNILLIHGLGGSTFSWRHNTEALFDRGYNVMLIDLPGFGYSSRKPGINHSQDMRARYLWMLIDSLARDDDSLDGSWILAGHSMGAGTVSSMAFQRPEQAKALVYIAGAVYGNRRGSRRSGILLSYPPFRRAIQVFLEHMLKDETRLAKALSSAYGRDAGEEEIRGYTAPLMLPGTSGSLIDMLRTAGDESPMKLKDLEIPVFGIWGARDNWVPPAVADRLKQILLSFRLFIIDDAGHCPMETHPEEFNKILQGILDKLE